MQSVQFPTSRVFSNFPKKTVLSSVELNTKQHITHVQHFPTVEIGDFLVSVQTESSGKTMEKVTARNKKFHTKESEEKGRNFTPRPSDVFITTYPKCGTTWVTQIIHGLRSKGDMDFMEITEVVPWDILALDCGKEEEEDCCRRL